MLKSLSYIGVFLLCALLLMACEEVSPPTTPAEQTSTFEAEPDPPTVDLVESAWSPDQIADWNESFERAGLPISLPAGATYENSRKRAISRVTVGLKELEQKIGNHGVQSKITPPFCIWSLGVSERLFLLNERATSIFDTGILIKSALSDLELLERDRKALLRNEYLGLPKEQECNSYVGDVLSLYPQFN